MTPTAVSDPRRPRPDELRVLSAGIIDAGLAAGLTSVGITSADTFDHARADLVERKRRRLNGSMQFTYRNPERSTDPGLILPGAAALVVGAWSYREEERPPQSGDRPKPSTRPVATVARYARRDHYASLRSALSPVVDLLRDAGWRATVVCDDNALVDRAAAHRAGLGWFGKNSLLLLPGLGSWFVLGSVVTDAPLRPAAASAPLAHGVGCGTCTRCMSACPTGALAEAGVVDATRCLAWLLQAPGPFPPQYRRALGDRIYGCDECQQACPINRLADRKAPPPQRPPAATDDGAAVDLLGMLEATDSELMDAHGRWYIPDRQPRYLRRNALVALGNVGRGDDPDTVRVLRHWLADDDPMLAEHARWSAGALGRPDLVDEGA